MTCVQGEEALSIGEIPLLEGFPSLLHLCVDRAGADIHVPRDLFEQVRSVRIKAGGRVTLWNVPDEVSLAVYVDRLCSANLQAAELCAVSLLNMGMSPCRCPREVVREMMGRCGDRFAFEVGVAEDPYDDEPGNESRLLRLFWRRWPAPDASDLHAARAAHERARAWAAAGRQWKW